MRPLVLLAAIAAALGPIAAAAQEDGETDRPARRARAVPEEPPDWPWVVGELAYSAGGSDRFVVGPSARITVRAEWFAIGVSLDYVSDPSIGASIDGVRTENWLVLGGTGVFLPIGGRWNAFALALGGAHVADSIDYGRDTGNEGKTTLPTVGGRVGFERVSSGAELFLSFGASVTALQDLRRRPDDVLGRDAGWPTVLVSLHVGSGL
jgi:hypothetical protein